MDIKTFKQVYLREFGAELTDEEAGQKAKTLMLVYKAVYGSPAIKELNEYEERNNDE